MEIKIFAQIEVSIDERFSRVDNATIILGDEAIKAIANAIAAQQNMHADAADWTCQKCGFENHGSWSECGECQSPRP